MDINKLLLEMTLEEKASLCSGKDMWNTKPIERLGIPSITFSDGPHGLRRQRVDGDNLGLNDSIPATCFPTASAMAASWDRRLLAEVGTAIAEECLQEKVSVLLGPGVNIKRSPLCGRNFEYYSEDPYLSGELAVAFIKGVQSKGVGTSLKHFAANNQEHFRMTIDVIVDQRALREIYLSAFQKAVTETRPWTVMSAYNRLNGTYCSEHRELLTDILKKEWQYEGLVITDWGACNDRVAGLKAGQEIEMPGGGLDNDRDIVEAVKSGQLDVAVLNSAVRRILRLIEKSLKFTRDNYRYDAALHHDLARKVACQGAVLLRNEDSILPLKTSTRIGVIGELAARPRYQGSGSSLINPLKIDNAYESLKAKDIVFEYAKGYSTIHDFVDEKLIEEACQVAAKADTAVVFAGLTDIVESEGFDRHDLGLPENQNVLIERIAKVNPNLVVVLAGGAPVEMPWIHKAKGILNMYLAGQAGGSAVVDLLFGWVNPSGKLAETYPLKYRDCLSSAYFPEGPDAVEYRESIFVGYRYYDTAKREVLFPFGHGLSYTTFDYGHIDAPEGPVSDWDNLKIAVKVRNSGKVKGSEVVQLYVKPPHSKIFKAEKELKRFEKVSLCSGEEKAVVFVLHQDAFAYYNVNIQDWHVENGEYEILIGSSSRDIRLRKNIIIGLPPRAIDVPDYGNSAPVYYQLASGDMNIPQEQFAAIYGRLFLKQKSGRKKYTRNSTLQDIKATFFGRILYKQILKLADSGVAGDENDSRAIVTRNMMTRMVPQVPLRAIATGSGGVLTLGMVDGLLMILNGQRIKGSTKLIMSYMRSKRSC